MRLASVIAAAALVAPLLAPATAVAAQATPIDKIGAPAAAPPARQPERTDGGPRSDPGKNGVAQRSGAAGDGAGAGTGPDPAPTSYGSDGRYLSRRSFPVSTYPTSTLQTSGGPCVTGADATSGSFVLDATASTRGCTRALTGMLPADVRVEVYGTITEGASFRVDLAVRSDADRFAVTCEPSGGFCTLKRWRGEAGWSDAAPLDTVPGLRNSREPIRVIALVQGRRMDVSVNGYWLFTTTADRELDGRVELAVNSRTREEILELLVGDARRDPVTRVHHDFRRGVEVFGDASETCRQSVGSAALLLEHVGTSGRCRARLPVTTPPARPNTGRFVTWIEYIPEVTTTGRPFAFDYADGDDGDLSLVFELSGWISLQRWSVAENKWTTIASSPSGTLAVSAGAPVRLRIQQDGDLVTVRQGRTTVLTGRATPPEGSVPALAINSGTRVRLTMLHTETLR